MAQGSLGLPVLASGSVLSGSYGVKGPFWALYNTCNTQSQQAAHKELKKKSNGKWSVMLKNIIAPDGQRISIIIII